MFKNYEKMLESDHEKIITTMEKNAQYDMLESVYNRLMEKLNE